MTSTNKWQDELARLQAIIQKTGLTETIKWGAPAHRRRQTRIHETFQAGKDKAHDLARYWPA